MFRKIILKRLMLVLIMLAPAIIYAQDKNMPVPAGMAQEVLKYVNEHRDSIGLPALKMNDIISAAALKHSKNMASHKIPLGHDGFDERVGGLVKTFAPANGGAENVVDGVKSARQAVDLWLHSPGHRKNIEGTYNLTGIGIAKADNGEIYITQIFVNKL